MPSVSGNMTYIVQRGRSGTIVGFVTVPITPAASSEQSGEENTNSGSIIGSHGSDSADEPLPSPAPSSDAETTSSPIATPTSSAMVNSSTGLTGDSGEPSRATDGQSTEGEADKLSDSLLFIVLIAIFGALLVAVLVLVTIQLIFRQPYQASE